MVPAAGQMTSLLAATLGSSGGCGVGNTVLVVLVRRCHACLPDVLGSVLKFFDDCSYAGRRLSPRDRAIIRELNETVFADNFLETRGTVFSESCEKVGYSILSSDPVITSTSPSSFCDF